MVNIALIRFDTPCGRVNFSSYGSFRSWENVIIQGLSRGDDFRTYLAACHRVERLAEGEYNLPQGSLKGACLILESLAKFNDLIRQRPLRTVLANPENKFFLDIPLAPSPIQTTVETPGGARLDLRLFLGLDPQSRPRDFL